MVIRTVVAPTVKGNDGYIRFPHWLPREYKQEINGFLHVVRNDSQGPWGPRCQELLHHNLMRNFWQTWVDGAHESAKANALDQIGGNLDAELPKHFRGVIRIMVYRGGPLPKEHVTEKLARRRKIANKLLELRALAREDDLLLNLHASTLVEMAQPQRERAELKMDQDKWQAWRHSQTDEDLARFDAKERAKDDEDTRRQQALLKSASGITFGMILDALHSRLKNGDPLDSYDAVKDDWYSPKGYKKYRQRLYLELQLKDLFLPIGDAGTQRSLIATALSIATGEEHTKNKVSDRRRDRRKKA